MSTNKQRSISKEQFWRRMVRQWRGSGLSVRAFCEEHGLSEPSFYAWRRTLAARDAAAVELRAGAGDCRARHRQWSARTGRFRRPGVGSEAWPSAAHRAGLRWADAAAPAGAAGGGPAMMLSLPTSVRIWLATQATDLRKSFDTLGRVGPAAAQGRSALGPALRVSQQAGRPRQAAVLG